MGSYQSVGWNNEKRASEAPTNRKFEQLVGWQTLEELEMEYEREAMDLGRIRDQQEDEEIYNHRKVRPKSLVFLPFAFLHVKIALKSLEQSEEFFNFFKSKTV